jgi:hypothetical protein
MQRTCYKWEIRFLYEKGRISFKESEYYSTTPFYFGRVRAQKPLYLSLGVEESRIFHERKLF